jgi:Flp pilus assembly protein TadB
VGGAIRIELDLGRDIDASDELLHDDGLGSNSAPFEASLRDANHAAGLLLVMVVLITVLFVVAVLVLIVVTLMVAVRGFILMFVVRRLTLASGQQRQCNHPSQ